MYKIKGTFLNGPFIIMLNKTKKNTQQNKLRIKFAKGFDSGRSLA